MPGGKAIPNGDGHPAPFTENGRGNVANTNQHRPENLLVLLLVSINSKAYLYTKLCGLKTIQSRNSLYIKIRYAMIFLIGKARFPLLVRKRKMRDSNPRYHKTGIPDFESSAFDHSANLPKRVAKLAKMF